MKKYVLLFVLITAVFSVSNGQSNLFKFQEHDNTGPVSFQYNFTNSGNFEFSISAPVSPTGYFNGNSIGHIHVSVLDEDAQNTLYSFAVYYPSGHVFNQSQLTINESEFIGTDFRRIVVHMDYKLPEPPYGLNEYDGGYTMFGNIY